MCLNRKLINQGYVIERLVPFSKTSPSEDSNTLLESIPYRLHKLYMMVLKYRFSVLTLCMIIITSKSVPFCSCIFFTFTVLFIFACILLTWYGIYIFRYCVIFNFLFFSFIFSYQLCLESVILPFFYLLK